MLRKAVFIDRDGTINFEKEYVYRKEDFEFIPKVIEALRLLSDHQIPIYIVTNQAGIAKGYYTEEDLSLLNHYVLDVLSKEGVKISDILYCPHHPEGKIVKFTRKCSCRKPEPGLIKSVLDKLALSSQDGVMIGDKNTDIEAGKSLGLKTYLVETGYGLSEKETTRADHVVHDLYDAVVAVLKDWNLPL